MKLSEKGNTWCLSEDQNLALESECCAITRHIRLVLRRGQGIMGDATTAMDLLLALVGGFARLLMQNRGA